MIMVESLGLKKKKKTGHIWSYCRCCYHKNVRRITHTRTHTHARSHVHSTSLSAFFLFLPSSPCYLLTPALDTAASASRNVIPASKKRRQESNPKSDWMCVSNTAFKTLNFNEFLSQRIVASEADIFLFFLCLFWGGGGQDSQLLMTESKQRYTKKRRKKTKSRWKPERRMD